MPLHIHIDSEKCVGCGNCIPNCHQNVIELRDGKAVVVRPSACDGLGRCLGTCPTGALSLIEEPETPSVPKNENPPKKPIHFGGCPGLSAGTKGAQWPIQLKLISPDSAEFDGADLLICADCVPPTHPKAFSEARAGKKVIIFCPKLDNAESEYVEKLARLFAGHEIRSIQVLKMNVPCCDGVRRIVEEAMRLSRLEMPLDVKTLPIV